jgi:putative peptidoglycan lipid II flippase
MQPRRLLHLILQVGSLTLIAKCLALGKELVVAREFGTSADYDAFLLAFALISFLGNVVIGSIPSALIPTYMEIREQQGQAPATYLFSNMTIVTGGIMLLVCGLMGLLAHLIIFPLLGSGFDPEIQSLAAWLFILLLPYLLINGLSTVWGALLNADAEFTVVAIAPAIVPFISLTVLILTIGEWGVYSLVAGLIVGIILQVALLAFALRKRHFPIIPRWQSSEVSKMRGVMSQYLPMLAGATLANSMLLVDQSLAALLGEGNVATLNYGNKLVGLLIAVGTTALGMVMLPHFSQMIAEGQWEKVRQSFYQYSRTIIVFTLPLVASAIILSMPIIRLFYQRGAFTAEDTCLVSQVQTVYLLQLPFYLLNILQVRLISALKANQWLLWVSILNLSINILLDLILMRWFGIVGIALSTTGVYIGSYIFLRGVLYFRLRGIYENHASR